MVEEVKEEGEEAVEGAGKALAGILWNGYEKQPNASNLASTGERTATAPAPGLRPGSAPIPHPGLAPAPRPVSVAGHGAEYFAFAFVKIKKFFKKQRDRRASLGANYAQYVCVCVLVCVSVCVGVIVCVCVSRTLCCPCSGCPCCCCWGKQRIKSALIVFYLGAWWPRPLGTRFSPLLPPRFVLPLSLPRDASARAGLLARLIFDCLCRVIFQNVICN